jgi:hypothetical protein
MPDHVRPELPDPQQDRHVAFPDHTPEPATPRPRRRGWLPYAAVIGVFVVLGNANNGHLDGGVDVGSGYSEQQWGAGPGDPWDDQAPDPAVVGWTTTVDDPLVTTAPIAQDSPVVPMPSDPTVLRIEVVSASTEPVTLRISTSSGLEDEAVEATPLVKELHLVPGTRSVDVTAVNGSETGETLQCRVYAGRTLVAIHTQDTGEVSCALTW